MQNDKAKFKEEFKGRVYRFALDVIGLVDRLSVEQTSRIITDQLLRSTTSIGANRLKPRQLLQERVIPISLLMP